MGVSGYSEFSGQLDAGTVRAIGITALEAQEYTDAPTFAEQGYPIDVQNWRMIAAAPGITDDEREELLTTIRTMANSDAWNDELRTKGWVNTYMDGDHFADYPRRGDRGYHSDSRRAGDRRVSFPDTDTGETGASRSPDLRKTADMGGLAIAVGLFLFAVLIAWDGSSYPVRRSYAQFGPEIFPYIIASGLAIFGIATVVMGLRKSFPQREPMNWQAVFWVVAAVIAKIALLYAGAGFIIGAGACLVLLPGTGTQTALADFSRRRLCNNAALCAVPAWAWPFTAQRATGAGHKHSVQTVRKSSHGYVHIAV